VPPIPKLRRPKLAGSHPRKLLPWRGLWERLGRFPVIP